MPDEKTRELRSLIANSVILGFKAGDLIFKQGDTGEWVYWIRDGLVKVTRTTPSGKEFITAVFSSGEMFGLINLYFARPFPVSARVVTDSEIMAIRKDNLAGFLAGHPGLALLVIDLLSARLVHSQARATEIACEKAEKRLTATIARLSAVLGNVIPFTQRELGEMTGITTETVIRLVRVLRQQGVVATGRGRITITDPDKLIKLVGEIA